MPGRARMRPHPPSAASPPRGYRKPGTNPSVTNKANFSGQEAHDWGFEAGDTRRAGAENVKQTQFALGREEPPGHAGHGDKRKSFCKKRLAQMLFVLCDAGVKITPCRKPGVTPEASRNKQTQFAWTQAPSWGPGGIRRAACESGECQTNPICAERKPAIGDWKLARRGLQERRMSNKPNLPRAGGSAEARRPATAKPGRRGKKLI